MIIKDYHVKKHIYKTRVRYVEVDSMEVVHNSKYLVYFEEARTDLVRKENYPYSKIEEEGIFLPVTKTEIEYLLPIKYDEEITVEVNFTYIKNVSIKIDYEIKNSKNEISSGGYTLHAFIDKNINKFVNIPDDLRHILNKHLTE